MTTTATPATVAPRMGMFSGVMGGPRLDSPGARLHTDDDDPTPGQLQRDLDAAIRNEKAAQLLANGFGADLAISEQALLDMTVQRDALLAQNVAAVPVLDVVARDVHRGTASGDLWGAYTTYTEGSL